MTRRSHDRAATWPRRVRTVALSLPILIAAWVLGPAS